MDPNSGNCSRDGTFFHEITDLTALVHTTRLEDMHIFKSDLCQMIYSDVTDKIEQESKPELKQIRKRSFKGSKLISYDNLCRKLEEMKEKCITTHKLVAQNHFSEEFYNNCDNLRSKTLLKCSPCIVLLQDFRKYGLDHHDTTSDTITISSDESDSDVKDDITLEECSIFLDNHEFSLQSLFTNVLLILVDNFSGLTYIYYLNKYANLAGYNIYPKGASGKKFINDYGALSTKVIIKKNCCWYKREQTISLLLPNCIRKSVSQFMRITHACSIANCLCCCCIRDNSNMSEHGIIDTGYIEENHSYYKETEEIDTQLSHVNSKLKTDKFENKYLSRRTMLMAIKGQPAQNNFIIKVLNYKQCQKITEKRFDLKYSLNVTQNLRSDKIMISFVNFRQNMADYYFVDNGKLLIMHRLEPTKYIVRFLKSLWPKMEIHACCWFKRKFWLSKLNLMPKVKNFTRRPHLCTVGKCKCCCKFTEKKKNLLDNIDISKSVEHMKLNKMIQRDVRLRSMERNTNIILDAQSVSTKTPMRKTSSLNILPKTFNRRIKNTHCVSSPEMTDVSAKNSTVKSNVYLDFEELIENINKTQNTFSKNSVTLPMPNTQNLNSTKLKPNEKRTKNTAKKIKSTVKCSTTLQNVAIQQVSSILPAVSEKRSDVSNEKAIMGPEKGFTNSNINNQRNFDENMLKSILSGSLKSVDETETLSLTSSILNRFGDVRLIITDKGEVGASLNTPIHTLDSVELKILANILFYAQKQVTEMLPVNVSTITSTNSTSTQNVNDTPYVHSYQSSTAPENFQSPVIENVFSLKNVTNISKNTDVIMNNNQNLSSVPHTFGQTSQPGLPDNNMQTSIRAPFVPVKGPQSQPLIVVNSGSIERPPLQLTHKEIESIMSSKGIPNPNNSECDQHNFKNPLLYALLNKNEKPINTFDPLETNHTIDVGTDYSEPAHKRKRIAPSDSVLQSDIFVTPKIISVSSIPSMTTQPENESVLHNENINDVILPEEPIISINDDEDLSDVENDELADKHDNIEKVFINVDDMSLLCESTNEDEESILGI